MKIEDEDSFEVDETNMFYVQETDEAEDCDSERLKPCENDLNLKMLFNTMDIGYCYQSFIDCGFTLERLRYLSIEDLELIFPEKHNIGLRAELREKLFQWKAINFPNNENLNEMTTNPAENWLVTQNFDETRDSTPTTADVNSVQEILQKSKFGRTLLSNYAKTKKLDNSARKKLINVIVEDFVLGKNITTASSKLLSRLSEEIIQIFPTENKDVYYISRRESGKSNPMGTLFNKFNYIVRTDKKGKKLKNSKSRENQFEPIVKSLQNKMKIMTGRESDALNIWTTTYEYRLSEIRLAKDLNSIIEQWPFFKSADAYRFIEYDFERLYPSAQYKLMEKWYDFKKELLGLFKTYVKDKNYQQLLHSVEDIACEEASTDGIFVTLLCAVLRLNSKYKTKIDGKTVFKNLTMKDTVDSLIVHLKVFSDLEKIKEEKRKKSNQYKFKIQPYIIVIGEELNDLWDFYVIYDNTLQKFSSFVPALDFCFKIFHVFHLMYPMESSLVWWFLQKYVYEIHTSNDLKNPRLSEIFNYFKQNIIDK